ncbi:S tudor-like domain [Capsicum annuum]|nr:S tudor-like domain [Capsicum annuum]
MGTPTRSSNTRIGNEMMRLLLTTFAGVVFGIFLGVNLPSNLFRLIDLTYIEDKYSGFSTQDLLNVLSSLRSCKGRSHRHSDTKIWVPSNPRGAERLPPHIVASESDLYPRRLWGLPREVCVFQP